MKILRCDLCNAIKETAALPNDKVEFFWADIREYDGYNAGDEITIRAHICPDCFSKIKGKIQKEETD